MEISSHNTEIRNFPYFTAFFGLITLVLISVNIDLGIIALLTGTITLITAIVAIPSSAIIARSVLTNQSPGSQWLPHPIHTTPERETEPTDTETTSETSTFPGWTVEQTDETITQPEHTDDIESFKKLLRDINVDPGHLTIWKNDGEISFIVDNFYTDEYYLLQEYVYPHTRKEKGFGTLADSFDPEKLSCISPYWEDCTDSTCPTCAESLQTPDTITEDNRITA